jgi:hypothetical protein
MIGPAGVYAGDRDMFVFMIDDANPVKDGLKNRLFRGFFVKNSEVGSAAFSIHAFLFNGVCQNHIVWGATSLFNAKVRHIGDANTRAYRAMQVDLKRYAQESAGEQETVIARSRSLVLGKNKEEVVSALFAQIRKVGLPISQTALTTAYDIADKRVDDYGAPTTLWGLVQGLTEHNQTMPYTDTRADADKAAGKLLSIAF